MLPSAPLNSHPSEQWVRRTEVDRQSYITAQDSFGSHLDTRQPLPARTCCPGLSPVLRGGIPQNQLLLPPLCFRTLGACAWTVIRPLCWHPRTPHISPGGARSSAPCGLGREPLLPGALLSESCNQWCSRRHPSFHRINRSKS